VPAPTHLLHLQPLDRLHELGEIVRLGRHRPVPAALQQRPRVRGRPREVAELGGLLRADVADVLRYEAPRAAGVDALDLSNKM
jgi:hypothetical protein